ncbi:hypothetical protein [Glycomyces paridis]|uniref:YbaB/EbfC family nucleoid-associated protein n=1 Tax=Glycomyces paridis TaxID=2126555 RepID=A0A4S8PHP5_9ACTN|nr:hypothetical protein [Glycomyces paridis]THV30117.1 hypothetical protein E9998_06985 [Glycomyces paridis]
MTSPEPQAFSFALPDDYEKMLDEARSALDRLPRDEHWEQARQALDQAPDRRTHETFQREGAQTLALIAEHQAARHTGRDREDTTEVVLDATGILVELRFTASAVRLGSDGLPEALRAAWAGAEASRLDAALAFAERSSAAGAELQAAARVDTATRQVQHSIQRAIDDRAHERFHRTTDDGRCTVTVDLCGAFVDLVCHEHDPFAGTDRRALARGILAAVTAAQADGAAVIGDLCEERYRELE